MMDRHVQGLETLISVAVITGLFGPILGLESNIRYCQRERIEDSSFSSYLQQAEERYGESLGLTAFALWTYPGAKLGVVITNSSLE